jgi:hypothetical protein
MVTARQRAPVIVPGLEVAQDWEDAVRGADAVLLLTEWREFIDLDWNRLGALVNRRIVIDGRNVLPGRRLADAGFVYASFGRGTYQPEHADASRVGIASALATRHAASGVPVLTTE